MDTSLIMKGDYTAVVFKICVAKQLAMVWAFVAKWRHDWVKKCVDCGVWSVGFQNKSTWTEVVQKDCQALNWTGRLLYGS